eukprot:11423418-Karenia_brevis.AAC.1
MTNNAVSDREDNIDNLSDVASDTDRWEDGDLWNMTCCEEAKLPSLYEECPHMHWFLRTKKLA